MKALMRLGIALLVALSLLVATTLSVAALTFKGEGFYARFGPSMATDVRGLVIGDRLGDDNPRLNVGLSGLLASDEFDVVGRSIGCNGMPSQANRVFGVSGMADANGGASFTRLLNANNTYGGVTSIWINQGEIPSRCVVGVNWHTQLVDTDFNRDGALGTVMQSAGSLILLLEKRPNGRARLSLNGTGIGGTGALRIRGVDTECGTPPTTNSFSVTFQDVPVTSFKTRVIDMTQHQLDAIKSVRINRVSGNNTWCGPVSLIEALLIP